MTKQAKGRMRYLLRLASTAGTLLVMVFCSDPADPAPGVESISLSLDSVAIQFRDSSSELIASPKGALGVELEAEVTWRSKNTDIVKIVPNGTAARLIPVRPGLAEVEATSENILATAKVVVLDTVFSVQINQADTLVTMGRTLSFIAAVQGPPAASVAVVWTLADSSKARIDSISQAANRVFVTSSDTGRTEVIATSAIDRKKSARIPFRTARPVSLFFETQPGQATSPIRAQDILIPGPTVKVRDELGNSFVGSVSVSMAIATGSGTPNANLFGTLVVPTASEDGRFSNIGIDLPGADFRLTATAAGLTAATSAPFTVGPECPGTPYEIGTTVSGTLTESACRSNENAVYARYIVTTSALQHLTARTTAPMRVSVVFPDGTRFGTVTDSVPYLAAPGTYSIRVSSGANGELGTYQLTSRFSNLSKGTLGAIGYLCWRIQTHRGITYQEELRCASGTGPNTIAYPCGTGTTSSSPYRLYLPANATATITASSAAFDPCLEVFNSQFTQSLAVDDNSGGGTTARIVLTPSPVTRDVIVNVTGRPPVPAVTQFTITITP